MRHSANSRETGVSGWFARTCRGPEAVARGLLRDGFPAAPAKRGCRVVTRAPVARLCGLSTVDNEAERGPAVPAISRDEVAHLARLSRLALSDAELDQFAGQLDSILSHVRTISEVAAADVPATASPNPATNVTRPDEVVPGLTPREALSGAPAVDEQRFMVPQILGEGE